MNDPVSRLESRWRHRGVDLVLVQWKQTIGLYKLVVPVKGQGMGSQVLQDIQAVAARHHKNITVTPSIVYGGESLGRVKKFYRRSGFRGASKEMVWEASR